MKYLAALMLAVFVILTAAACKGHGPPDDVYARWYTGRGSGGAGGGGR